MIAAAASFIPDKQLRDSSKRLGFEAGAAALLCIGRWNTIDEQIGLGDNIIEAWLSGVASPGGAVMVVCEIRIPSWALLPRARMLAVPPTASTWLRAVSYVGELARTQMATRVSCSRSPPPPPRSGSG